MILSIEKLRAIVRDLADRREEAKVKVGNAEDDWDFESTLSANEVATCGVRGKIKQT